MNLKDKGTLESLVNRTWMYRGTNYRFNDIVESNDQVIISTDVKAIRIPVSDIQAFAKELLPVDAPAKSVAPVIRGLDGTMFQEIGQGLMSSFREISTAPDKESLKTAVSKAKTKVKISQSITGMAKVVLEAQRIQDK